MDEVWLPVVGYESIYEVSSLGRVRRIVAGRGTRPGTTSGRVLRQFPRGGRHDYYLSVTLSWEGRQKKHMVHGLVARAFHGPPPVEEEFGEFQAHHVNDDRRDNRACNLEWRSSRENREVQWANWLATGSANP